MQHTIAPERLQAAQCALNDISRVWTFTHLETGCACRAEYAAGLLSVEVTEGPTFIDVNDDPHGWAAYERAVWNALDALAKAGVLRTHVADARAVERELRLIASSSLQEIAP